MFKIAYCLLKVKDGKMTAELTINSKSYDYLYAGTAEDAAKADSSAFLSPKETDGGYIFEFPVEALDKEIKCAAFSHKKQLWYDRTLVFRADSIDQSALPQKEQVTVSSLGLADGNYTVEVKLEGGSGRASVQSPAKLTIKDGNASAEIIWSSNKYDYMRIGEEKYLPKDTTEFSVFEIPVSAFDTKLKVAADTTAMSTPHEIEYTLYFDSASIKQ
jgi:heme-binding NEAT domain protein